MGGCYSLDLRERITGFVENSGSTCRARILEGEIDMVTNHALEDYGVSQGYVLTCQCYPLTPRVVIDYDLRR